jgi:hypothetical protein
MDGERQISYSWCPDGWAAGHDESAQVNRNGELRASGIARRRTEEKRAEAFFPPGVTTTAVDSKRDARAALK